MILDYHPQASDELIEAAGFYERGEKGLGYRFLDAVEDSVARLNVQARLAPSDERGRRRYLIHGFPYVVIYRIEDCLTQRRPALARRSSLWNWRRNGCAGGSRMGRRSGNC